VWKKSNITLCVLIVATILYISLVYVVIIDPDCSQHTHNESVFEKHGKGKIVVAFRNDDLTANSNLRHEESVLTVFWQHRIKQTFALIPNRGQSENNGSIVSLKKNAMLDALQDWSKQGKIEFALHGYSHQRSEGLSGEFDGLPYNDQLEKIKKGKSIFIGKLNSNVEIFVPPWNQADSNTIEACLDCGIHIFSGYMGGEPTDGITFVNSNAALFPKENTDREGIGIPSINKVLKYAKNSVGTTFIVVFYHSRTDFERPEHYSHLSSLLTRLADDSSIEICSIGEIAANYGDLLPAYNQAGLNIKEALMGKHKAKPYVLLYGKANDTIGRQLSIDTLFDQAFYAYWGGDYQYVSRLSKEIIRTCDNYIVYGRITAVLCSAVVYLMFLVTRRYRKIEAFFGHYRNLLLICTLPLIIAGSYLNVFRPISVLRIEEFNIITGLYVGGITVGVALIIAARKRKASGLP
jgi:hypothetical protein